MDLARCVVGEPISPARSPSFRIRVLGPVSVQAVDSYQEIPGRKTRMVLAALVIGANRVVAADRLIDALWREEPPPSASATLQAHVSKLRRVLGEDAIIHRAGGYGLRVSCEQIDACRFERLLLDAEAAIVRDSSHAHALCRRALDLWRGRPFGDLADEEFVYLEVRRLEDLRLSAEGLAYEAEIEDGSVAEAVAALRSAVVEHPYHERLWYLLTEGLAREGRRAEALKAFARYTAIVADAGMQPDGRMEALAEAIRTGDAAVYSDLGDPMR